MSIFNRRGYRMLTARRIPIEQLERRRLLATVAPQVGLNFEGIDYTSANTIPPDTQGAVGLNDVIAVTNNRFRRFDRYGNQQQNISLDQFWSNAGVNVVGSSFQPRVEYDPGRDRFYICALDNPGDNNAFLFAISNSSDAADGWTGFRVDSDAGSGNRWAEFPSMGFDNDGVYITANMLDIPGGLALAQEVNILVLPKIDLLAASPNVDRHTVLEDVSATTGISPVPIISIDPNEGGAVFPPRFVKADGNSIDFSTLSGTVFSPSIANLANVPVSGVTQFNNARQPDGTQNLDAGDWRISSHVYEQDAKYWIAQSIEGASSNGAIRFAVVDSSLTLVQYQHLENSSADYIYPSIAVNEDQDVAIGFTRTGPDAGEYPSAYVIMGTTSGNTTTFDSPRLIQAGSAAYHRNDGTGANRWGDYSQTVLDPKQNNAFWTFQEFAKSSSNWGTWIAKVSPNGVLPGDLAATRGSASGFVVPFGPTGEADDLLSFDAFIDSKGDIDTYYFGGDAAVGSNFEITVNDGASLISDPCVAVYDADTGGMVAFDEDSGPGDAATVSFNGANNKRYILAVADEFGGTGDYFVDITYGDTAPGVNINLGQYNNATVNVDITANVDPEFYRFTTPADAVGNVYMRFDPDTASLAGTIWVFDSAGNVIKRQSAAYPGNTFEVNLTNIAPSTEYFMTIVSDHYETSGTAELYIDVEYVMGPLGLTYTGPVENQLVPSASTGVARDDHFVDVSINNPNDIHAFYIARDGAATPTEFTIQAYDPLQGLAVDPVVAIYRDNGNLVAWSNDGGPGFYGAQLTFTPQQGKRYIVAVCAYSGTGDVMVKWDRGTPLPANIPLSGGEGGAILNVVPESTAFYRFTTPAFTAGTGTVQLSPSFGILDGVVLVTNASGAKIGSADFNNPGAPDTAHLTGLQGNTTYYITTASYDYLTGGTASLQVSIDILVPPAPGTPDLDFSSDSGFSATDNITSDNTPTFTGASIPSTTVHLFANGIEIGTGTTNGLGAWSITTPTLPQATISFTAKAEVGGGLSPASAALSVTIDRTAPTIPLSGLSLNSLFAVQAKFDEEVSNSLAVGDFVITQAGTGTVVPNAVKSLTYTAAVDVASITFPTLTNTVLPDGNYNVSINAAAVEDLAGNSLAANHAFSFFFLQGDADRNRMVDTRDFNLLAGNFGGGNKTFGQGNFNFDAPGAVDSLDFNIFTGQYGKNLPAPAAIPGQAIFAPAAGLFGDGLPTAKKEENEVGVVKGSSK